MSKFRVPPPAGRADPREGLPGIPPGGSEDGHVRQEHHEGPEAQRGGVCLPFCKVCIIIVMV